MPTRKGAGSKKGASKSAARKSSPELILKGASLNVPPYGVAIRQAAARGDAAEMKRTAAAARKHLADVQKALEQLEKKLGRYS
ncbi:MAG TPA: DUF1843 domain-containing protein [Pyrinomonadaceae bacterium]|nr:DUF1843 domain-containing protein [Pyrinomonadaceae bacterium]